MAMNYTKVFKRLAVVSLLATCLNTQAYHLVDGETKSVLPLASITDNKGNVVAMTSQSGEIPPLSQELFPITFNYTGYEPMEVDKLSHEDVSMVKHIYNLPDIIISPESHPLLYLTAYMREVSSLMSSSDSLTFLKESIVDFLVPVGKTKVKGWRKPRELASKTYVRMIDSEGLDSVSNEHELECLLWTSHHNLIPSSNIIPSNIQDCDGVAEDTIMGKYYPKYVWRRNGNVIHCYADALADEKTHTSSPWLLKMLGLTTDLSDMSLNYVFTSEEGKESSNTDVTQVSLSMDMLVKGRIFKKSMDSSAPVNLRSYAEVFVIDRKFVSDEDAKSLKKDAPVVKESEIIAPANAPGLHQGLKTLVERVKSLQ